MMLNYNPLEKGRDALTQTDVGFMSGIPPTKPQAIRTRWLMRMMMLMICLSAGIDIRAQVSTYSYGQSNSAYVPIVGTVWQSGVTLNTDAVSGQIPLGFTFRYNHKNYTSVIISNNGFVTLGNTAPAASNVLPISTSSNSGTATNGYEAAISAFGTNLIASTASGAAPSVRYGLDGGDFVIQYTDVARTANASERVNFQIRLTQTTHVVTFRYGNCTAATGLASFPQVGLRGASSWDWRNLTGTTSTSWTAPTSQASIGTAASASTVRFTSGADPAAPVSGQTYTFTPPAPLAAPTYATIPATENFDAAPWANGTNTADLPNVNHWRTWPTFGDRSWRRHNVTLANAGWQSNSGSFTIASPASGGAARFHMYDATTQATGYMDYYVDFSTPGLKQLNFDHINTSGTDVIRVSLSTDGGATFGPVLATFGTATSWTNRTLLLGDSSSATCVIRFEATGDYGTTDPGIDNVAVTLNVTLPGCATLSGPADAATNVNRNVILSWTAAASASAYDLYFGTSPSPSFYVTTTGTTYSFAPALAPNTTYYWSVVPKNVNGSATGCVTRSFTTSANIVYCIPTITNGCNDGDVIARVQLNTLDNSSGAGCPSGLSGYSNYTSNPALTTTLQAGSVYNITIYAGQYNEAYAAWIDYNDDGFFDNVTERVGYSPGLIAGSGNVGQIGSSASFPIAIACNPPVGQHRLRVRAMYDVGGVEAVSGSQVTPCTNNQYGEVEDYIITISAPAACPQPSALASSNVTASSADLSWTIGCNESAWEVAVQIAGSGVPTSGQPSGAPTYHASGLIAGNVYEFYVRANCGGDGYSAWTGPYIFTPPGCSTLLSPTDMQTGVPVAIVDGVSQISLDWSASPGATSYDVYWGISPSSLTMLGSTGGDQVNITNVLVGTTYYWSIVPKNSNGQAQGCLSTVFSFTTATPPGDVCATAISLDSLTSPVSGSTSGMTDNYLPTCIASTGGPDVFYSITVPAGFTFTIADTANAYDSGRALLSGTCSNLTQVACADDPDTSVLTYTNSTAASQVIYFVQDGYSTNSGAYTLSWTLTPPPVVVSGFSPVSVCSADADGTVVTLTGSNFTAATNVQLNGEDVDFTVVSDTQISVTLSETATSGTFEVFNAVTSGANATVFTVNANPTVAPTTAPDGATNICLPETLTLSNLTPTGVWSSSNVDIATINTSGVVTSVSVGNVIIAYTVTNALTGCVTVQEYALSISAPVQITGSTPTQSVVTGGNTSFSVTATGSGNPSLTYMWEVCTDGSGVNFEPVVNGGNYSGADTPTLSILNAPETFDFYFYQCTVTGTCNAVISDLAVLLVGETGISEQPQNAVICDSATDTVQFTVVASDDVTAYQWYEDQGGDDWQPVSNTGMYSGATSATLTLDGVTAANSTWRYKVVVTGIGSVESNPATLTVVASVGITTDLTSQAICYTGGSAIFSVEATGGVASYSWQYSSNGGASWNAVANGIPAGATYSGVTSGNLTVNTTAATPAGNYSYRVIVNANAPCANTESASASLLITTPVVSVSPSSGTICLPGGLPVALVASGADTYTWSPATGLSASTGASVTANPATTTTYTVVGTTASGCSASTTVTITVSQAVVATVTAPKTTVCPSESLVLTAAGLPQTVAGYQFSTATGATLDAMAGASQLVGPAQDDGISSLTNIGFTFKYGGVNYTQFSANSNGMLRLGALIGSGSVGYTNSAANAGSNNGAIFPYWDDISTGTSASGSAVRYVVTGIAPNRVLKVEWFVSVPLNTTGAANARFQAWLYEGSNNIEFRYGAIPVGGSYSVGLASSSTVYNVVGTDAHTNSTTAFATSNSASIAAGRMYTFTPPPTYTYSWSSVPAGFSSAAANPTVNPAVNTTYNVVVTSSAGCVGNGSIAITVESGASITTNPVAQTVCQGQPATFTVAATGPSLTYQWRRNGVNLTNTAPFSGTTTATLSISAAAVGNAGNYDVVVTPSCGTAATSTAVALVVNALPAITTQPVAPAAICATAGTATISVVATGASTYQWRRNGVNLSDVAPFSGATTATLTITNPAATEAGSYDVIVSSVAGCSVTSAAVAVTINAAPPVGTGVSICQGGSGALSATVTCNGFANAGLTISGGWAAGAPTAFRPTSSTNSTSCGFSTLTADLRTYAVTEFQVSVTGSYVIEMNNNTNYDGMAYIVSGAFTPGSCTGGGSFVIGDDDSAVADDEPRLTATLTAGTTYKLISTMWTPAAPYVGTFAYTVTPPSGGQIMLQVTSSDVVWYTAASGGSPIGTGNSFNPVGVAGSGLANTDTPGSTTYYAACSANTVCRTPVTFTINANVTYYADADNDGYGNPAVSLVNCTGVAPAGYVANNTDCNDAVAAINPGAPDIPYNGVDDDCDGTIDETGTVFTTLLPTYCGTTLASIHSIVGIYTIAGHPITGYRIRATNGSEVQTIETTAPHFVMTQFASYAYATTYTIEIQLQRAGLWQASWGAPCFVSTPAILAEGGAGSVNPLQCGITLSQINTLIATSSIQGVTGYRFRVSDLTNPTGPNAVQTIERTQNWFSLPMLARYNYGTLYRIEVSVKTTGTYGGYGAPCELSSPPVPSLVNCGGTVPSKTSTVAASSVPGATQYRFQVVRASDNASATIDRGVNWFNFNMVPSASYTAGALYFVRVAVMTAGTWSPFGDACEFTAPGGVAKGATASEATATAAFKAAAYPNPFTADFSIEVTTPSQEKVQFKVYDMLGKLVESREADVSDLNMEKVGAQYPAGVYNVIVSQGGIVKTLRVIKR